MGQSVTYPSGQTLTSTALTIQQINVLVQALTCGALGIVPVDYSQVRVDWQVIGQPDVALPSQDSCYLSCVTEDVDYSRVRDRTTAGDASGPVTETWVYTRGWRVSWDLYGPNSFDRARQIHSSLFMDYFNDQYELSNLYQVLDPPEPVRVPIEHNAQWFDHSAFHCRFYEQVTETITTPTVISVGIAVYDGSTDDPVATITVPPTQ
jgi:hypothetical protein